jgi:protein gp37
MGKTTGISWTDHTHNFWYGCTKISSGCKNCYAERDMKRFGKDFSKLTRSKDFNAPLRWKEPARVFINSWSDFFHPAVPTYWLDDAWEIIRKTPHLTYQILTKRPQNIEAMLPRDWGQGWPNVWLGVSVENQQTADERIPWLLKTPAAVRFVSVEPMLGPVDLYGHFHHIDEGLGHDYNPGINWVIAGCESGPQRRHAPRIWFRSLLYQCREAGVPFFLKQMQGDNGEFNKHPELDGRVWDEFPG